MPNPSFVAELRCLAGCDGVRFPLTEPVYRCPTCSGLLDVLGEVCRRHGDPELVE